MLAGMRGIIHIKGTALPSSIERVIWVRLPAGRNNFNYGAQ